MSETLQDWKFAAGELMAAAQDGGLTLQDAIDLIKASNPVVEWKIRIYGADFYSAPYRGRTAEEVIAAWAQVHENADDGCHLGNGGSMVISVARLESKDWTTYRVTGISGSIKVSIEELADD